MRTLMNGTFSPGSSLRVNVWLEDIKGRIVKGNINANVLLPEPQAESANNTEHHSFSFPIPKDTLPNTYTIQLTSSDSSGNTANTMNLKFNVSFIASVLTPKLSRSSVSSGETLSYSVNVLDQENHPLSGRTVTASFISGAGVYDSPEGSTNSNGTMSGSYKILPEMPIGAWKIRFESDGNFVERDFTVVPYYNLTLFLGEPNHTGEKIIFPVNIANYGNINISSEVTPFCEGCISMRPKEVSVAKGKALSVNITWYYPVSQPPGNYSIYVCMNTSEHYFCSGNRTFTIGQTLDENTGYLFLEVMAGAVGLMVIGYSIYYKKRAKKYL